MVRAIIGRSAIRTSLPQARRTLSKLVLEACDSRFWALANAVPPRGRVHRQEAGDAGEAHLRARPLELVALVDPAARGARQRS